MRRLFGKSSLILAVLLCTLFFSTYAQAANLSVRSIGTVSVDYENEKLLMDQTADNTQDYYSIDGTNWLMVIGDVDLSTLIGSKTKTIYYKEDLQHEDYQSITIPSRATTPAPANFLVDYEDNTITYLGQGTVVATINYSVVEMWKGKTVPVDGAKEVKAYVKANANDGTFKSAVGKITLKAQAAAPAVKYVPASKKFTGLKPQSASKPAAYTEYRFLQGDVWGDWTPATAAELAIATVTDESSGYATVQFRTSASPDGKVPHSALKMYKVFTAEISAPEGMSYDMNTDKITDVKSTMEYAVVAGVVTEVPAKGAKWTKVTGTTIDVSKLVKATEKASDSLTVFFRYYTDEKSNFASATKMTSHILVPARGMAPKSATYSYKAAEKEEKPYGSYTITKDPKATNTVFEWAVIPANGVLNSDVTFNMIEGNSLVLTDENKNASIWIRTAASEDGSVNPSKAIVAKPGQGTQATPNAKAFVIDYAKNVVKFPAAGENKAFEIFCAVGKTAPNANANVYTALETADATELAVGDMIPYGSTLYVRYAAAEVNGVWAPASKEIKIVIPAQMAKPNDVVADHISGAIKSAKKGLEWVAVDASGSEIAKGEFELNATTKTYIKYMQHIIDAASNASTIHVRYAATAKAFASDSVVIELDDSRVGLGRVFVDYEAGEISGLYESMEYKWVAPVAMNAPAVPESMLKDDGYTRVDKKTLSIPFTASKVDGTKFLVRFARTKATPESAPKEFVIDRVANSLKNKKVDLINLIKSAAINGSQAELLQTLLNYQAEGSTIVGVTAANAGKYNVATIRADIAKAAGKLNHTSTIDQVTAVNTALNAVILKANESGIAVTGFAIKTSPKTAYVTGEALDLTALVVTITRSEGAPEDVAFANFASKGITVTPITHGAMLNNVESKVLTVTHTSSGMTKTITINVIAKGLYTLPTNVAKVVSQQVIDGLYRVYVDVNEDVKAKIASVTVKNQQASLVSGSAVKYVVILDGSVPTPGGLQAFYDDIKVTLVPTPTVSLIDMERSNIANLAMGGVTAYIFPKAGAIANPQTCTVTVSNSNGEVISTLTYNPSKKYFINTTAITGVVTGDKVTVKVVSGTDTDEKEFTIASV